MGKGGSTVHQTDPKILPEDYYEALTRGMLQESANEKYAQAPYAYNYASHLLGMPQTQSRNVYSVVPSYGGSRDPFWGGGNSGDGLGTLGFRTDTYEYPLVGASPGAGGMGGGEEAGGKGSQPTQGAHPGGKGSATFNGLSQAVSQPGGDGIFYSADGYDVMNPRITNIRNGQSGYLTPAYSQLYQFQVKPPQPKNPRSNRLDRSGNGGDASYRDRTGGAMGILDDPLNRGGRDSGGRGYDGSRDRGRDVGGMGDDTGGGMNW